MNPIAAALTTLVLGPVIFWIWSRTSDEQRFPTGIIDGFGDVLFLPAINASMALLWPANLSIVVALIAGVAAAVGTISFTYWRKNIALHNDWTRPVLGTYTLAGWYHTTFMFVQLWLVCIGVILFWSVAIFWIPVCAFLLLVLGRFLYLSKKKMLLS